MRALVAQIKRHPALYDLLRHGLYARVQSARRRQIFLRAYQDNLWGDPSSLSGPGSDLRATQDLRAQLPGLLASLEATSMLDAPCGDLAWMKHVAMGRVRYIGADIVAPMIERHRREMADFGEFLCLDLLAGELPRADVVFCRDCLVHLSHREIRLVLRNVKASGATYLLTTTFPGVAENIDTVTPYWRAINLQAPPFDFPPPLRVLKDHCDEQVNDQGKHLAAWRCADLPVGL